MKSRLLALILAGLLVVSFTGCASSDSGANASTPTPQDEDMPTPEPSSQPSSTSEEFSPLEIKEYGYSVHKGQYLYCVVTIQNPNNT